MTPYNLREAYIVHSEAIGGFRQRDQKATMVRKVVTVLHTYLICLHRDANTHELGT